MNTNIKTGEEIRTQQGMMFDNYHTLTPEEALLYKEKSEEKWVSLAWLKERRQKQTPGRFLDIIDSLEG